MDSQALPTGTLAFMGTASEPSSLLWVDNIRIWIRTSQFVTDIATETPTASITPTQFPTPSPEMTAEVTESIPVASANMVSAGDAPIAMMNGLTIDCPIDLVIMIDQSSSVDNQEFEQQRDFVLAVINELPMGTAATEANVAVGFFSSTHRTDVDFGLTSDGAALINDVTNYVREFGATDTGEAIIVAQDELVNNGRANSEQVIVVLTDGDPSPGTTDPYISSEDAQDDGTNLFGLGIYGEDFNPVFPILSYENLEDIAGDRDGTNPPIIDDQLIYRISFDTADNPNLATNFAMQACGEPFAPIPDDPSVPISSSDTGSIVFTNNHNGDNEIWRTNGMSNVQLTFNIDEDTNPSFSPDGADIAFQTDRNLGVWEIYKMDSDDGSNQTYLAEGIEPDWHPDEPYIVYARGSNIFRVHSDIGETSEGQLTNYTDGEVHNPVISNSGDWMAYERDGYLYTYNLNCTSNCSSFLLFVQPIYSYPAWSPDDSQLAFNIYDDIYTATVDYSGGIPQLTNLTYLLESNDVRVDTHLSWTSDGKIIFETERDGNRSLYKTDGTTTGTNILLSHGGRGDGYLQVSTSYLCNWNLYDNAVFYTFTDRDSANSVASAIAARSMEGGLNDGQLDRILDMSFDNYHNLGQVATPLIYQPTSTSLSLTIEAQYPDVGKFNFPGSNVDYWIVLTYGGFTNVNLNCQIDSNPNISDFSVDSVIPVGNLFTLSGDLSTEFWIDPENDGTTVFQAHPLYTFYTPAFVQNYILGLDDFRVEILSCTDGGGNPDSRTTLTPCGEQIFLNYLWQHNNRFNSEILDSANYHAVPPLLLKVLLMQESGLLPALTPNSAGATGIAQFVTGQYKATLQLINDGRGGLGANRNRFLNQIVMPNISFTGLSGANQYHNLLNGITGTGVANSGALPVNCQSFITITANTNGNPVAVTPSRQSEDCQDYDETILAIEDSAYYLRYLYNQLNTRITQNISTSWSQLDSTLREKILWTWVIASYNQGNGIYNVIPSLQLSATSSANIVCSYNAVLDEANRYTGAIITGNPGSVIRWCDLQGQ